MTQIKSTDLHSKKLTTNYLSLITHRLPLITHHLPLSAQFYSPNANPLTYHTTKSSIHANKMKNEYRQV